MSMRAVRYDRFGPPDVLHVETVPRPTRGDGEVLVEVHSASAGGGEPAIRAGKLRRLVRPSFPEGSGVDFAGRVTAAGPGDLSVGDAVWGVMPHRTFGALAEYVSVPPGRVSLAPRSITLSQAAALPAVGTTVLAAFTQHALLRPGDRLLVRGGSGGVGSTAVQLAKHLGAHVTAMVSARDTAWVRELGADVAVDYRADDLTGHQPFDLVLDTVGTDLRRY